MKQFKKLIAMILALAMTVSLVACGGDTSAGSSAGSENASQAASTTSGDAGTLAGKPWVLSFLQGNLPAEQPEVKDDLYAHYAYDYLASHQMQPGGMITDYAGELKEFNLGTIKDGGQSGHDLDQLRIFFSQAADAETLKKTGLADVQPYLDRIDAVSSLSKMNELLSSKDFPFSPFVLSFITLADTRDANIVSVNPNLALVDAVMVGGTYYQDTDDPQEQATMTAALQEVAGTSLLCLMATSMTAEERADAFDTILAFEKQHGKYVDFNGKYLKREFGAMAGDVKNSYFTLDELCAACPNFPMKVTLENVGKGASPRYVSSRDWLKAFNGLWTEENLNAIKLIAKVQVLKETLPYRDPSPMNQIYEEAGRPAPDAESFAYEACNQQSTFAIVLANNYVSKALGQNAQERLTKLSQDLIDTYKELVGETAWMSEESKKNVLEKLDHMTLNVLEPTGGYYDFSGVDLTPTNEGGTLLGNYLKLKQYRLDQESKMIGQAAVPASPWFQIRPTEANAFYDYNSNSINILPGFVTSLIYGDNMSYIEFLSGAGFTIGHEISHGFDFLGSQFDAYGTPNPVLADADVQAFVDKTSSLAAYYKTLEISPGVMVNGENVVAEAAADLNGMHAIVVRAGKDADADYKTLFSRVSTMWAQVYPAQMMPILLLDTHTLNNHRVNVCAQMFEPLYTTYGVKEGDGMYLAPEKRINIWGPNA